TARVFERTFVLYNRRTIYFYKPRKHVIKIRSFRSTNTRRYTNSSGDLPTGNNSPLKPKDNNKNNVATSNTGKETPSSTATKEETESIQTPEECQSQPSSDNTTEHVAEYILRSPTRRKRSITRSRTRASKSSNSYKPVIPQLFLNENYLSIKNNSHSFAKMSYPLEDGIRDEILYSARANLFPVPKGNGAPARRGHLLLNCPIEGASYYLDSIVKSVAASLHSDLLTFDRQDLMELTA
ncbi:1091_t:CDS:1, partial [Scutellospora calospora]